MGINRRFLKITITFTCLWITLFTGLLSAQSEALDTERDSKAESGSALTDEAALASVQEQLFELLRMSPRLTSALAYDPSLLGYREYINEKNPALGRFLESHPEVTRNPEFYLFGNLRRNARGNIPPIFRQTVIPAYAGNNTPRIRYDVIIPFLVFIVVLGAVLWLLRLIVQNRRWGRVFKAQTEVHTKLLDKIGGSPELLNYLETEPGKKFLNLAPVIGAIESPQHLGTLNPISRMLAPLQVGIVAAMIGIGILLVRTALEDSGALLLFGTLGIMLGIGLILSAGISWLLARRLGWISQNEGENTDSNKTSA